MSGLGRKLLMFRHKTHEEWWRGLLTGEAPAVPMGVLRKFYRHLPATSRCKLCNAPFEGLVSYFFALTNQVPSRLTPNFCQLCENVSKTVLGGAEVNLTLVFADVRGSTALAETMSPSAFAEVVSQFFSVSSNVLLQAGAWLDRLVGDQVVGIFLPGFVGPDHAAVGVRAAQDLQHAVSEMSAQGISIGVGVGVHTDVAYVGAVGSPNGATDITVLGDAPNTAARLSSAAGPGEILVSESTWDSAQLERGDNEVRLLDLKGKRDPLTACVLRSTS